MNNVVMTLLVVIGALNVVMWVGLLAALIVAYCFPRKKQEPTCGQCEYFTGSGCRMYHQPPLKPWSEDTSSCWRFKKCEKGQGKTV